MCAAGKRTIEVTVVKGYPAAQDFTTAWLPAVGCRADTEAACWLLSIAYFFLVKVKPQRASI